MFKDFNKKNNIDKIEELNDTMQELTEQVLEINETLGSEPLIDIDENELLAELDSLVVEPNRSIVSTIELPMVPQNGSIYRTESPTQQLIHQPGGNINSRLPMTAKYSTDNKQPMPYTT